MGNKMRKCLKWMFCTALFCGYFYVLFVNLVCGFSMSGLVDYYRQFNTIGLISLNDWYVLEFHLKYKHVDIFIRTVQYITILIGVCILL